MGDMWRLLRIQLNNLCSDYDIIPFKFIVLAGWHVEEESKNRMRLWDEIKSITVVIP